MTADAPPTQTATRARSAAMRATLGTISEEAWVPAGDDLSEVAEPEDVVSSEFDV